MGNHIQIRVDAVENGYVITFGGPEWGLKGSEYVARSFSEVRDIIGDVMSDQIDRVYKYLNPVQQEN